MDNGYSEFSALEFWLEVESFRTMFDQIPASTQLSYAAYIQQRFLLPHAPRRIIMPLVQVNQPEMLRILREISASLEDEVARRDLFDDLLLQCSMMLNPTGLWNSRLLALFPGANSHEQQQFDRLKKIFPAQSSSIATESLSARESPLPALSASPALLAQSSPRTGPSNANQAIVANPSPSGSSPNPIATSSPSQQPGLSASAHSKPLPIPMAKSSADSKPPSSPIPPIPYSETPPKSTYIGLSEVASSDSLVSPRGSQFIVLLFRGSGSTAGESFDSKKTVAIRSDQLTMSISEFVEQTAAKNKVELKSAWIVQLEGRDEPLTGCLSDYLGLNLVVVPDLNPSGVAWDTNVYSPLPNICDRPERPAARVPETVPAHLSLGRAKTEVNASRSRVVDDSESTSNPRAPRTVARGSERHVEKRRDASAGSSSLASSSGAILNSRERIEREANFSNSRENSGRKEEKESEKDDDVNLKIFRQAASKLTLNNKTISKATAKELLLANSKLKMEFRRMLKVTIVGSLNNVGNVTRLLGGEEEYFVLGDTLIKLNPFIRTPNSRFFAKLLLSNPGLVIFTTTDDLDRSKFLEGFSTKMHYILLDAKEVKSHVRITKSKKERNFQVISLEKHSSHEKRRETLLSAIESFLKKSNLNLKTLSYDFPLFLSPAMNSFITTLSQTYFATKERVVSFFLESFCSSVQAFHAAPNDTNMTIQIHRYTNDAVLETKKTIPCPDVGSFVLVQDILIKYFHFAQDVLESSLILSQDLETILLDSQFDTDYRVIHVIPNWKTLQKNLLSALELCGWLIPLTPDVSSERQMFMFSSELLINLCVATLDNVLGLEANVQKSVTMALSNAYLLQIIGHYLVQNLGFPGNCQSDANMLFNFMQAYDLIMPNESSSHQSPPMYFVPLLINVHQKKNVGLELKINRKEFKLKRYFVAANSMPFSFLDRIFSVLFFSVNNFIPAEITLIDLGFTDFSPEASLLYRIDGGLSYISVEFEKNVVVLKFAGLEADSTFFCDFCSLIRIITRNKYYNIEVQEIVECPLCQNDTHNIEDLLPFYLTGEQITCAQEKSKPVVPMGQLAPEFLMHHNRIAKAPPYRVVGKLGEGAFGVVSRGVVSEGPLKHSEVAIKKFKSEVKGYIPYEAFEEFLYEAKLADNLINPFVLRQIGVDGAEFALIQEIAKFGVLGDLLHKSTSGLELSKAVKKKMVIDIASGLNYLHTREPPIIHRDIRSFNIFVFSTDADADVNVKIGDFGLSIVNYVNTCEPLESWQWVAPEVILGETVYDSSSDIYSFGIVIYEIFSRVLPFSNMIELLQVSKTPLQKENKTKEKIEQFEKLGFEVDLNLELIIKREFKPLLAKKEIANGLRPKIPEDFRPYLVEILNCCWDGDTANRPSAATLVEDFSAIDVNSLVADVVPNTPTKMANIRVPRPVLSIAVKGYGHVRKSTYFYNKLEEKKIKRESRLFLKKDSISEKLLENIKTIQNRESVCLDGIPPTIPDPMEDAIPSDETTSSWHETDAFESADDSPNPSSLSSSSGNSFSSSTSDATAQPVARPKMHRPAPANVSLLKLTSQSNANPIPSAAHVTHYTPSPSSPLVSPRYGRELPSLNNSNTTSQNADGSPDHSNNTAQHVAYPAPSSVTVQPNSSNSSEYSVSPALRSPMQPSIPVRMMPTNPNIKLAQYHPQSPSSPYANASISSVNVGAPTGGGLLQYQQLQQQQFQAQQQEYKQQQLKYQMQQQAINKQLDSNRSVSPHVPKSTNPHFVKASSSPSGLGLVSTPSSGSISQANATIVPINANVNPAARPSMTPGDRSNTLGNISVNHNLY